MKMLIMGAPGSGKGTQAEVLTREFGIPAISTGAMLRAAIADGTQTGVKAARYINGGQLVPDDVMIDLVLDRIAQPDCEAGYILDGFPRTLAQAEAMDKAGIRVDRVLQINASDEEIQKRLGGRRVCGHCGATYHVFYKPSEKGGQCQVCDTPLAIRDDDKPETIARRLAIYHEQTAPVLAYYKDKAVTVQSREEVADTTKAVLEALGRG